METPKTPDTARGEMPVWAAGLAFHQKRCIIGVTVHFELKGG